MMAENFSCVRCVGDKSGFPDYKIRRGKRQLEYWVLYSPTSEIDVTKYLNGEPVERYVISRNSHGPEISEIQEALETRSISPEMYNSILSTWVRKGS
jgi:hypothetical protein